MPEKNVITFVDVFAGIGGTALGLERSGMICIGLVEKDRYRRNILASHWPNVLIQKDVRNCRLPQSTLISGSFPCQDLSSARTTNIRRGLEGRHSGLWKCFASLLGKHKPKWVLIENVSRFDSWVPQVRADLSSIGYASVPVEVQAAFVGAPHKRPRIFVVAHADRYGQSLLSLHAEMARLRPLPIPGGYWRSSPSGGFRLADGVPDRMAKLAGLGNAVVPQVAELIGREIIKAEGKMK